MTTPHTFTDILIRHETVDDLEAVEELGSKTFGPGRFSRASFRLREGVAPDTSLCFVAECRGGIAGSVRMTHIMIGDKRALVLGPLMISPSFSNLGIGRELMNRALWDAYSHGHRFVVLVGDYAYYRGFGFERIPHGQIVFPGPADPQRILGCEFFEGITDEYRGETKRYFGEI